MKRFLLLLATCLLFAVSLNAQLDSTKTAAPYTDTIDGKVVFTVVQVQAQFPGGTEGWRKYLEKNLNANLGAEYIPLKRKQKSAKQTVTVSFIVDTEGTISEVMVMNGNEVHPKLAEEAIRVIKSGPKWIPATQNGKNVAYRQKQNISWIVEQ
jgi:protein TonB